MTGNFYLSFITLAALEALGATLMLIKASHLQKCHRHDELDSKNVRVQRSDDTQQQEAADV